MPTAAEGSLDIETNQVQSQESTTNLNDKSPGVRNEMTEADEARNSIHPAPLRINSQVLPYIPVVPGISLHHQSQYVQGHNSSHLGHNSPYANTNPYRNVSQSSFFSVLQDNYRHSSLDSSSGWDSVAATPTSDRRRPTSLTWGSRNNLLARDEMSVASNSPYTLEHPDYEKSAESPTTEDLSPPGSTVGKKSTRKEEVQAPAPPPGPPAPTWSRYHEWLFILTVCSAQFLSLASLAQTISPLLIIGNDLNIQNPGQLAWFTASYSMTLGTFIIPAGKQFQHG